MSSWLMVACQVWATLMLLFGVHVWRTLGRSMAKDKKRRAREAELQRDKQKIQSLLHAAATATTHNSHDDSKVSASNGSSPNSNGNGNGVAPRTRRLSVYDTFPARSPVNPFVKISGDLTQTDRLHMAVGAALWLVPRVIIVLVSLVWCWFWATVAAIGNPDHSRPFVWWRIVLMKPMFLTARAMLWAFGFLKIRRIGRPASVQEAPFVICNHMGPLEGIAIIWDCLPHVVVAEENMRAPMVGRIIRTLQAVTVNRTDPLSRKKSSAELEKRAKTERGQWQRIAIFPEGTTTNGQAIVTFRPGAFYPAVPVQPVVAHFHPPSCPWTKNHPEIRRHNHPDPSWVGHGPGFGDIAFTLLTRMSTPLTLEYLPVYTPSEAEQADPNLFAKNVRALMAKRLGALATNHTFDDVLLQRFADKTGLPNDSVVVEFGNFQQFFNLNISSAKNAVDQFAEMDRDKDGNVNRSEFVSKFNAKCIKGLDAEHLFKMMDEDGDEMIDFRDYLIGFACIHDKSDTREWAARITFRILDNEETGKVSIDRLRTFLTSSPVSASTDHIMAKFDDDITKETWKKVYLSDPALSAAFLHIFPNPANEVRIQ